MTTKIMNSEVNNNANMEQQVEELKLKQAWTAAEEHSDEHEEVLPLYDTNLLRELKSVNDITSKNANLIVRPLQSDDFNRGYLELLKQLTSVGDVTQAEFKERFLLMKSCQGTYYNTVIVDKETDCIIGAASLIVERKFIHHCANRGIIEEVIVSDDYRGKSLGRLIVQSLVDLGKALNCYKITLNCTDQMISFYERLGFVAEQGNANFLVIRNP
eukprot:05720.XXX_318127_319005_1 [CDS] Oithona nana genome sequencing.